MLAHLTDADLAGQWLLAGLAAAAAGLAFVVGRISARHVSSRPRRRAEGSPEG